MSMAVSIRSDGRLGGRDHARAQSEGGIRQGVDVRGFPPMPSVIIALRTRSCGRVSGDIFMAQLLLPTICRGRWVVAGGGRVVEAGFEGAQLR